MTTNEEVEKCALLLHIYITLFEISHLKAQNMTLLWTLELGSVIMGHPVSWKWLRKLK